MACLLSAIDRKKNNMRPFILAFITAISGLFLLPAPASAFDIVPTVSLIELPQHSAGISVVVRNPRNVPLPVSMDIVERFVNEDGSEETRPADDLFMMFPPQAVIPPGSSQAVRVQWLAAPPVRSRSFTLFATEIPVDLQGAGQSQVQTILRMGASVHVAPTSTRAKPVLVDSSIQEAGVRVTLANDGDRFYYVDAITLDFGGNQVSGIELANAAGRTLIPPGARRTFNVPDVSGRPTLIAR